RFIRIDRFEGIGVLRVTKIRPARRSRFYSAVCGEASLPANGVPGGACGGPAANARERVGYGHAAAGDHRCERTRPPRFVIARLMLPCEHAPSHVLARVEGGNRIRNSELGIRNS